jgi:hypothetical protein
LRRQTRKAEVKRDEEDVGAAVHTVVQK